MTWIRVRGGASGLPQPVPCALPCGPGHSCGVRPAGAGLSVAVPARLCPGSSGSRAEPLYCELYPSTRSCRSRCVSFLITAQQPGTEGACDPGTRAASAGGRAEDEQVPGGLPLSLAGVTLRTFSTFLAATVPVTLGLSVAFHKSCAFWVVGPEIYTSTIRGFSGDCHMGILNDFGDFLGICFSDAHGSTIGLAPAPAGHGSPVLDPLQTAGNPQQVLQGL
ncbi:uncharacterized protein LOC115279760 [Suricata suricatta]|uniref:uncharacterized protein LOC115279760 n=1 Tax=Suricata suricatta TaxID=37032 RepID=UPI00115547C5|nr:uncharacterized protein LOC115279760 [Suricata suricatta]